MAKNKKSSKSKKDKPRFSTMTKLVDISTISVAKNRQRKEFAPEAIIGLSNSIERIGLMHPIVCRKDKETGEIFLVAGERRLRAIQNIYDLNGSFFYNLVHCQRGVVPINFIDAMDDLSAAEAELEENTVRLDLTWQERITALKQLDQLRNLQAIGRGENHTVADLAQEVRGSSKGYYQEQTRRELIVAEHLDDKEVKAAKNVDEAYKGLKRKEEAEKRKEIAVEVGKTFNSSNHQLFNDNCLHILPNYSNKFDVILTDPPYGIGADTFGDGAGRNTVEHRYKDNVQSFQSLMQEFIPLTIQITKPQAHLYLFCDIDNFIQLRTMLRDVGWRVHRTPIINTKQSSGRVPWPDMGPRRQWEMLLYATKGDKHTNFIAPDVIHSSPDKNIQHGAQKPVSLYKELLRRSIVAGDKVIDPFCGTGTIFQAANLVLCQATGIELDPVFYAISKERLDSINDKDKDGGN